MHNASLGVLNVSRRKQYHNDYRALCRASRQQNVFHAMEQCNLLLNAYGHMGRCRSKYLAMMRIFLELTQKGFASPRLVLINFVRNIPRRPHGILFTIIPLVFSPRLVHGWENIFHFFQCVCGLISSPVYWNRTWMKNNCNHYFYVQVNTCRLANFRW